MIRQSVGILLVVITTGSMAWGQSSADPRLQQDPKRPGFWVIKPQPAGSTPTNVTTLQEATPSSNRPPVANGAPMPPRANGPAPIGNTPPVVTALPAGTTPPNTPEAAPADDGKIVLETWDKVYIKDLHVGYFHVIVKEFVREGKKYLYATKTSRMWVARFGQKVEQWGEDATLELAENGQVLTTSSSQGIGRDQMLTLKGKVEGNLLKLKVDGAIKNEKDVPWPDGVIGVAGEAVLYTERTPKPGEKFSYLAFEARVGRVVKFDVIAHGHKLLRLSGTADRKVLHLTVAMEPLGNFKLAPADLYCDAETMEPLLMEQDVPGLGGRMKVARTDKDSATRPVGQVPDLFDVQSVKLNRVVENIHALPSVTYRISSTAGMPPAQLFPADARQIHSDITPQSIRLTATANPSTGATGPAPGPENLGTSFFIDWDNATVKQHAAKAIAGLPATATPLQKAQAVERWVHGNMRSTEFSQAMATCSNVANTLSGDCSEYSMLATGMCRALGIPARTALGVVYAEDRTRSPFLAYHAWFEIYADGRWMGFDATLGRGGVGPGHLKITDAHWHEEKSFAPLLPVLGVLQSVPKVEVLETSAPAANR